MLGVRKFYLNSQSQQEINTGIVMISASSLCYYTKLFMEFMLVYNSLISLLFRVLHFPRRGILLAVNVKASPAQRGARHG